MNRSACAISVGRGDASGARARCWRRASVQRRSARGGHGVGLQPRRSLGVRVKHGEDRGPGAIDGVGRGQAELAVLESLSRSIRMIDCADQCQLVPGCLGRTGDRQRFVTVVRDRDPYRLGACIASDHARGSSPTAIVTQ
jgi:hypothetical protein